MVSVPFDAGRGLMRAATEFGSQRSLRFSTLRCGSWIDAFCACCASSSSAAVSVPFDAGRGLMPCGILILHIPDKKFQYPSMRVVD